MIVLREGLTMNTGETARYLEVHENTLYRLIREEGLPFLRVTTRRYKFRKQDIDRWLEKRRKAS